jgi:hypothetical protein
LRIINDVIEELKTSSEKSRNLWDGVFKKWAALRNIGEDKRGSRT